MKSIQVSDEEFDLQVALALTRAARYCQSKKGKKALERSAVYFMTWNEAKEVFGKKKAKKLWEWGERWEWGGQPNG